MEAWSGEAGLTTTGWLEPVGWLVAVGLQVAARMLSGAKGMTDELWTLAWTLEQPARLDDEFADDRMQMRQQSHTM